MVAFSYFIKNETKPSKPLHTSILMLVDNSKAPLELPSIRLSIRGVIQKKSFTFKVMVIVACKIIKINKCL
jgi:hypothetical protein